MVSTEKLDFLLDKTRTIISHQREMKKVRGETFNVFSILNMERRENETHSAFLAELLSPNGSHLRGNVFLQHFLETIEDKTIELETAQAKVEHHIGPRNDKAKTGGRVDIFIWDSRGNCICIENKIDAGDQHAQIERYCNHNKEKNRVYYLTLKGAEPSDGSKGGLINGEHFYTISYREQILEWLDKCIKEAAEQPILRESIKQYKLLIQKITSTMDKKHQQDLTELMLKHFDESAYIADNFVKVSAAIKERIRQSVIQKLKERLPDTFVIHPGNKADKHYSQIWFKVKGFESSKLFFGIESFSGQGNYNGALFIGTFNGFGRKIGFATENYKFSNYWINTYPLPNLDHYQMHLGNSTTLKKIHTDKVFYEEFVNHIVSETDLYLAQHVEHLRAYLAKGN